MPDLFIFLLKVNAALLLFCAGYYLVLRHLTFYTLNRIYLVGAILFATIYPKINLSAFAERHQQIAKPVQTVILNWQAPAKALVEKPDYWLWIEVVFWAGVVLLGARLLIQLYSLYKLYRSSTASKIHGHEVRVMNNNSGPFSFWKSIYINPANHEPADLKSILQHEHVHVSEWHTVDVLLAELSTIFYWFNPGVWLMKKAVKENIEFITDRKILKNGTDTKQYQYSLVNVSFSAAPQGIVNHFNMSTIKKRIIMMNAKRSSKAKLTRYVFLVPAVVALLLVFSISKAALISRSIKNIKASSIAILAPKSVTTKTAAVKKVDTNTVVVIKKVTIQPQFTVKIIDTNKKGTFSISSSNSLDSCNIVVNGIKMYAGYFNKINPNDIESVNVVRAGVGSDLIYNLDKTHGTVFVTTKGSDSGTKFKEKLDRLLNNNAHVIYGSTNTLLPNKYVAVGSASNFTIVSSAKSDSDSDVASTKGSGTTKTQSFNIVRSGSPSAITVTGYSTNGAGARNYTSRIYKDSLGKSYSIAADTIVIRSKDDTKLYKVSPGRTYSNFSTTYSPASVGLIDHIADKMVIINGKISTQADLKKISAFDIDKIVVKNDNETKELYGDKAKNGIVFIVTKK